MKNTTDITKTIDTIKKTALRAGASACRAIGHVFKETSELIDPNKDKCPRGFRPKAGSANPDHKHEVKVYDWKKDGDEPGCESPVTRYSPTYRVWVFDDTTTKAVAIIRVVRIGKRNRYEYDTGLSTEVVRIAAVTTEKHEANLVDGIRNPLKSDDILAMVNRITGNCCKHDGVDYATAKALFLSEFAAIQCSADPKSAVVQWSIDGECIEFRDPVGASGVDFCDIANDLYWLSTEGKPGKLYEDGAVYKKDPDDPNDFDMFMPGALAATAYNFSIGTPDPDELAKHDDDWHANSYSEMSFDNVAGLLIHLRDAIEGDLHLTSTDLDVILKMYHMKVTDARDGIIPGDIINRYRQLAMAYADGDEKMLWASAMCMVYSYAHADHVAKILHDLTPEESEYLDTDDEDAAPVGRFAEEDTWKNPYDAYIPDELLSAVADDDEGVTPEKLYRAVGGDKPYVEPHACAAIVDLTAYGPMAVKDKSN